MPNEDPKAQVVAFLEEKLSPADRMMLAKLVSNVPGNELANLAVAIAESTPRGTEVPVIAGDTDFARLHPHAARIVIRGPSGDRRTL